MNNDLRKYYGFLFWGKGIDMKLCPTPIPVTEIFKPEAILAEVKKYVPKEFKALYGYIKELAMTEEGKILGEFPSKVNTDTFQAFILKRKGDEIETKGKKYLLNKEEISQTFSHYVVTIIEVEE